MRSEVWQIYEQANINNHFGTNREVIWVLRLISQSDTERDAQNLVINLTRSDPTTSFEVLPHLVTLKTTKSKQTFLEDWCFSDDINDTIKSKRRFFIQKPTTELMKQMVKWADLNYVPLVSTRN